MALTSGTKLGPYQVTAPIGAGGMGEVYRATDTDLKRQVALKVLPASVAGDADRLARFQREAEVLASLNHPNIAAIYGLEKSSGISALVMELIEGPTLADRIGQSAIPVDEALPIARQIAEALEAAHERSIVHRDLKPANIKLRPDGTVKVLDFGLAKAMDSAASTDPAAERARAATITSPAMITGAGIILGTAAYMSPEQARGKAVDKRADNWAFGCVLFESLTGQRAFVGDEVSDVLAHVLAREPDWRLLPDNVPPGVHRLLVRCLTKDHRQRLHDIGDARLDIEEAIAARLRGEPAAPAAVAPRPRRWGAMALVAGLSLAAGLAAGSAFWSASPTPPQITRATLEIGPADELGTDSVLGMLPAGSRTALTWSPDGRTLAFIGSKAGTRQVFLRGLNDEAARPLDGTQGTRALAYSPDGEWVAYWTDGELRKIRVAGGPPTRICAATEVNGISWGPTRIVYTTRTLVFEVSPAGGEPRALTQLGARRSSPFLLPDERAVLYTEYGKAWTSGDERVMALALTSGATPTVLVPNAADARYLTTGHLAYLRQGTVFVIPFDAKALQPQGEEVAVLNGVAQAVASWSGADLTLAGQLAVSSQGTLAYVASPPPSFPTSELVRVNRRGEISPLDAPPNTYRERIESSPDGKRVAVSVQTTKSVRLFIYDMVRGTLDPAFAESASLEAVRPIWSSDGRIALHVAVEGVSQFALFRPDATAGAETATASGNFTPSAWSPGGDLLIGTQAGDLWTYAHGGTEGKWVQRTSTPANERFPAWSPDGNWLAYVSNVSGRDEVYVEPYPGPGKAISVSNGGAGSPAWNPKGGELFYVEPRPGEPNEWRLMSAAVTDPRSPGRPVPLFSFSSANLLLAQCSPTTCYSVAPDGQSFFTLRVRPRQAPKVTSVRLIVNWHEELKRLAPSR